MKRLKWILLTIVLLIVIAVTVVILRLDAMVRYAIESQSTTSLGLTTQLDSAHVSLLGGKLSLRGYHVHSPKGFVAAPMFRIDDASVGVSVGHLRNDPVGIDRVVIDKPRLVIEQSNGKFNFQTLTELMSSKPAESSEPMKLIIQELAVNNAEVVIRPGIPGLSQEITLPIPSFEVKQIGTGEGNKNGVAIRQVITLVVMDLAKKASESDRLPEDVRKLLSLNVDQIKRQVEQQVQKKVGEVQEKIEEEAGKAIDDLLKGKSEKKKK